LSNNTIYCVREVHLSKSDGIINLVWREPVVIKHLKMRISSNPSSTQILTNQIRLLEIVQLRKSSGF